MMSKQKIYFLLDSVLLEYKIHYKQESEKRIVEDLKEYLPNLSKTSVVTVVTSRDVGEVGQWLASNDLNKFVNQISKSVI